LGFSAVFEWLTHYLSGINGMKNDKDDDGYSVINVEEADALQTLTAGSLKRDYKWLYGEIKRTKRWVKKHGNEVDKTDLKNNKKYLKAVKTLLYWYMTFAEAEEYIREIKEK
jgi:hypothetical protein